MMTRPSLTVCITLAALGFPGVALADPAPDTVIVTALRTPVDADRVPSSVTVIDQTALERAQPLALTDVLSATPGISVARNGGYGQVTSVRIRGADPSQSVVVIDGMRVADPTAINGGFDFARLFTDDIGRVEILRGPQSILWGSDAIGGIVNVTTISPTKGLQADLSVEAGSHQTVDAHAGIGGTSRLIDWRIAGSAFSTEGIPTLSGGTVSDGYNRRAASVTATVHLAPGVSLDLRGYWDSANNSFSDTFTLPKGAIYAGDYALTKQWTVYAGLNFALIDGRFKSRLSVQENRTDNEDFDPANLIYAATPALSFIGHGKTVRYEYEGTFNATKGVDLVFGAEREEQHMRVGSPYDAIQPYELFPETAATNSAYGEARVTLIAGLTLNGGVRYDHHSQFGGNTVFSAGGVYTPDDGVTLVRATYDEGFRAPSLYQLYSDYGNAALRPEHASGWEVGAQRSVLTRALQFGATWWQRHSTNLIGFAYCNAVSTEPACAINGYGYYDNIDKAAGRGLELTGQARIAHVLADANYSIVVNEDRTPGSLTYGQQLPRVPRHVFNGSLGYDWPLGLITSVAVRRSGSSLDGANPVTLPAYTLVDVRAEWKAGSGLTVFGRVDNIGNTQYRTAYGYNSLGRTAYVGLRGHF